MTETDLEQIRPEKSRRVLDLVAEAGIDVSDWSNFKGGAKKAASNPKYCYEWAFVEAEKVVLLNLWFASMQVRDNAIVYDLSMREFANSQRSRPRRSTAVRRSIAMDQAVQTAINDRLPIRVIVCEGSQRDPDDPDSKASKVKRRFLDPEAWVITSYDWKSGRCALARGGKPLVYIDQFGSFEPFGVKSERKEVTGKVYTRSSEVRKRVLLRAGGSCEWCGEHGFRTHDGRIYLETHHIQPLADGGEDAENNVAALCANHHREAHFGSERVAIAVELKAKIRAKYAEQIVAADV